MGVRGRCGEERSVRREGEGGRDGWREQKKAGEEGPVLSRGCRAGRDSFGKQTELGLLERSKWTASLPSEQWTRPPA